MFSADTKDKALWLVVLLPGFVTIGIARLTSSLPGLSDFQLGILYFVVTIVNAAVALSIAHVFLVIVRRAVPLDAVMRSFPFLAMVAAISVSSGVILAVAYENAWINRVVQSAVGIQLLPLESPHPTIERLLRTAISKDEFDDRRRVSLPRDVKVVRVLLEKDANPILGKPARWSRVDGQMQLYLSPACIETNGRAEAIAGPGVWLSMKNVQRIDFLNLEEVDCVNELMPQEGERLPRIPW